MFVYMCIVSSFHSALRWRAREFPGSFTEICHVCLLTSRHSFLLIKVFFIFKHSETQIEITLLHEYIRFLMKITHGILLEVRKVANKMCIGNEDIFLA